MRKIMIFRSSEWTLSWSTHKRTRNSIVIVLCGKYSLPGLGGAIVDLKIDWVVFVSKGFDVSCVGIVSCAVWVVLAGWVVSVSVTTVVCFDSVVELSFSVVTLGWNGAPVVEGSCVSVVISFVVVVGSSVVVNGTWVVDKGRVVVGVVVSGIVVGAEAREQQQQTISYFLFSLRIRKSIKTYHNLLHLFCPGACRPRCM